MVKEVRWVELSCAVLRAFGSALLHKTARGTGGSNCHSGLGGSGGLGCVPRLVVTSGLGWARQPHKWSIRTEKAVWGPRQGLKWSSDRGSFAPGHPEDPAPQHHQSRPVDPFSGGRPWVRD